MSLKGCLCQTTFRDGRDLHACPGAVGWPRGCLDLASDTLWAGAAQASALENRGSGITPASWEGPHLQVLHGPFVVFLYLSQLRAADCFWGWTFSKHSAPWSSVLSTVE